MDIVVRDYQPKDKKTLIKFLDEFRDYIVKIDTLKRQIKNENSPQIYTNQLVKKIQGKNGKIFLAFDKDIVIGFSACFIRTQSEEDLLYVIPTKTGEVIELFVTENYRGKGVGKKLMSIMEEYFKKEGCTISWVEVFAPNKSAYEFYRELGYTDRMISVMKEFK